MNSTEVREKVRGQVMLKARIAGDSNPALPSDRAKIEKHMAGLAGSPTLLGQDRVIERQGNVVLVDGRRILIFEEDSLEADWLRGRKNVRDAMRHELFLNACILDFLFENQEFIPDWWKLGGTGFLSTNIFFWGTIFCEDGRSFVGYLQWDSGRGTWSRKYSMLGDPEIANNYSVYLESFSRKLWRKFREHVDQL